MTELKSLVVVSDETYMKLHLSLDRGEIAFTITSSGIPREIKRLASGSLVDANADYKVIISQSQHKHLRNDTRHENACETKQCAACGSKKDLKKCARCKKVYYCSLFCRTYDWTMHERECGPTC